MQQFLLTVLQSARVKAVISGLRKRHATLTGVNQKQTEVEIKLPAHLNFALHYFAVLFFISNNIIMIIIIVAVIISISYRIIVIIDRRERFMFLNVEILLSLNLKTMQSNPLF